MTWRKITSVAAYEYRTHFRRFGYLFATFGLPLLGMIVLVALRAVSHHADLGSLVAGNLDKPIAVWDQAGVLPPDLPDPFVWASDLAQGKQAVIEQQVLALVVIPPNYATTQQVTIYVVGGMASSGKVMERLRVLMLYAALGDQYPPEQIEALAQGPKVDLVVLGDQGTEETGGGSRFGVGYALSVLFFVALFTSAGYLLQSVAQEKESRIMELLLSSVSSLELLWGKVLGLGALGLTQVAVWLVSSRVAIERLSGSARFVRALAEQLRSPDPQLIIGGVVILPLSYLTYALLMAGLGSLGGNLRESQQFSAAVTMLAAVPFMVNFLFFLNPNGLIPRLLSYFPFTAPIAVLLRLSVGPIPWWDLGVTLGMIGVGTLVSVWVGVRLFRVGVLMTGKKPSWREVWRIVRNPA